MRKHDRAAPSAARMVAWTAVAAVLCWGATLSMVRAVAQESPPPGASAPDDGPVADPAPPATADGPVVDDDDTNEEAASDRARAPVTLDELPEFRDSADNNISLPVDI